MGIENGSRNSLRYKPDTRVKQIQSGSSEQQEAAFSSIAEEFGPKLLKFINRRLRGNQGLEAEDILQGALIKIWQGLPKFRANASLSTWLHQVTLNHLRDEARRTKRQPKTIALHLDRLEAGHDEELLELESFFANPEREFEVNATLQQLMDDVSRLPIDQQQAIALRDWQGLSYDEIADIQSSALSSVKWRIFKGRETVLEKQPDVKQALAEVALRETQLATA